MNKKYTRLIIIFLIVAPLTAFGRIAGNNFINLDDGIYITGNDYVRSGINPQTIKWAFTAVVCTNWQPLTLLSHALDWSLFGANPCGHHIVSLLLHIGATLFVFLFFNKTTTNLWSSAFIAALFALHPLRVESVAWAASRKDVLSMFFGMACLYAYAFYAEKPGLSKYLLCLILLALALMAKQMLVTLPFVLMLLDYWPLKRWQKAMAEPGFNSTAKLILEKVPFICLAIAAGIVTVWAHNIGGVLGKIEDFPVAGRIYNAVVSYVFYLEKTFRPVELAIFYPYEHYLPPEKILISGLLLIIVTAAVIYVIRKAPYLFVGWFWYLGTLVPVIGLVQIGEQANADHYTYLPSVGLAIMISRGIPLLFRRRHIREKILFPAAIAVLFMLAVFTWIQCGYWKNSVTIFSHALVVTKNNYLAHYKLGIAFFEKGEKKKSLYHFNRAILMSPRKHIVYNSRGVFYLKHGLYQQALDDFNKAIALNPDFIKAYNNRGTLYADLGENQLAIMDFSKAIDLKKDYATAYHNRASIYFKQGDTISGCEDAKKACKLKNCKMLEMAENKGYCR